MNSFKKVVLGVFTLVLLVSHLCAGGNFVAVGDTRGRLHLYDLDDVQRAKNKDTIVPKRVIKTNDQNSSVEVLASHIKHPGKVAFALASGQIGVCSIEENACHFLIQGILGHTPTALTFHPNYQLLVVGYANGVIRFYDMEKKSFVGEIKRTDFADRKIVALGVSENNTLYVSFFDRSVIYLCDLEFNRNTAGDIEVEAMDCEWNYFDRAKYRTGRIMVAAFGVNPSDIIYLLYNTHTGGKAKYSCYGIFYTDIYPYHLALKKKKQRLARKYTRRVLDDMKCFGEFKANQGALSWNMFEKDEIMAMNREGCCHITTLLGLRKKKVQFVDKDGKALAGAKALTVVGAHDWEEKDVLERAEDLPELLEPEQMVGIAFEDAPGARSGIKVPRSFLGAELGRYKEEKRIREEEKRREDKKKQDMAQSVKRLEGKLTALYEEKKFLEKKSYTLSDAQWFQQKGLIEERLKKIEEELIPDTQKELKTRKEEFSSVVGKTWEEEVLEEREADVKKLFKSQSKKKFEGLQSLIGVESDRSKEAKRIRREQEKAQEKWEEEQRELEHQAKLELENPEEYYKLKEKDDKEKCEHLKEKYKGDLQEKKEELQKVLDDKNSTDQDISAAFDEFVKFFYIFYGFTQGKRDDYYKMLESFFENKRLQDFCSKKGWANVETAFFIKLIRINGRRTRGKFSEVFKTVFLQIPDKKFDFGAFKKKYPRKFKGAPQQVSGWQQYKALSEEEKKRWQEDQKRKRENEQVDVFEKALKELKDARRKRWSLDDYFKTLVRTFHAVYKNIPERREEFFQTLSPFLDNREQLFFKDFVIHYAMNRSLKEKYPLYVKEMFLKLKNVDFETVKRSLKGEYDQFSSPPTKRNIAYMIKLIDMWAKERRLEEEKKEEEIEGEEEETEGEFLRQDKQKKEKELQRLQELLEKKQSYLSYLKTRFIDSQPEIPQVEREIEELKRKIEELESKK